MNLKENKEQVFSCVKQAIQAAHRREDSVQIVAVTKYVDKELARDLIELGVCHIGENRVDKFLDKYHALKDKKQVRWHLIGTLQRRKVKEVINYVDYFHALDSVKLAHEINKRADKVIRCFLQVNLSREESKHGFLIEELEAVLPQLESLEKIEILGLMTMAPVDASHEELTALFAKAKDLQESLKARSFKNMPFSDMSIGMSRDYREAIQHGATFVRIGTAFFR